MVWTPQAQDKCKYHFAPTFRELIAEKSCDLEITVTGVYVSYQSQQVQVVGYLSVKAESEESFT